MVYFANPADHRLKIKKEKKKKKKEGLSLFPNL